jgi:hypothetical protein
MKECDNSTRKIHISSNFILSISLLIMFDTLILRPTLHYIATLRYTSPHFTQLHFTTFHHTSPNYTSPNYTSPNYTSHNCTSPNYTSLHFTTLHPTTLHYTSPHFTQLYFTTLIDTSLPHIYTSLLIHLASPIYISYRSISPHITKLDTVQFSSPNLFPK